MRFNLKGQFVKTACVVACGIALPYGGVLQAEEAASAIVQVSSECETCAPETCCAPVCDTGCCDSGCCDTGCCEEPCSLQGLFCDGDSDITFGGWTQIGYHSRSNSLFNKHDSQINLHQQYMYVEKVADGSCGFDYGFRADLMYGTDAQDTQAFGNPPGTWDFQNGWDHGIYGWAMPQLYGEVAYGDLSVKAGHFYTIIGYEVVTAPDNFFYSHAFTMYNSEPFTHTGVLATYNAGDGVTLYGGWTAGWDTGFERHHQGAQGVDSSKGSSFLGGVSVELTDSMTFTYATTAGDLGWRGEGYSHSLVLDYNITDDLEYVIQSDLVNTNNGGDHQVGVNQYLFYQINDTLRAGVRAEWWKTSAGNEVQAVTYGVNIKATDNLVLRPEMRHQWADNGVIPTSNAQDGEAIFGIDAILTY